MRVAVCSYICACMCMYTKLVYVASYVCIINFCSYFGDASTVCYIYCDGDEDKITDCELKLGCYCDEAVGVECCK